MQNDGNNNGNSYSVHMLENIYHNKFVRSSSLTVILEEFYPDKVLGTRDLKSSSRPYVAISKLVGKKYLEKTDEPHPRIKHQLTLLGKCRVLCQKYGLRFLCLCILCEAYFLHKHQIQNKCNMVYVIQDTKDMLNSVYTDKSITNAATLLHNKGFTFRRTKNTIQITGGMMTELDLHYDVLNELHKWVLGVPMMLNRMVIRDPDALEKLRISTRAKQ